MQRKYVIDECITFTPADGTLSLSHSSDTDVISHVLPPPAARLLLVLLQRNSELATKEDLLAEVWENHGMTGSLHNLAHYTMLIRKAFKALHYEKKIIITVHKQGMMINPEISYRISSTEQDERLPVVDNDMENDVTEKDIFSTPLTESDKQKVSLQPIDASIRRHDRKRILSILSLILFCIIGAVVITCYLFSENNSKFSEKNLRLIENDNKCKFYTYNTKVDDKQLMKWIDTHTHTDKFNLSCDKDWIIIYYTDAFLGPNISGKKFHTSLTLCLDSQELDKLNSCVSHYYN